MTQRDYLNDVERLLDGDCSPEEADRLRARIDGDVNLRDAARRMQAVDEIVRATGHEQQAPDRLRQAVVAKWGAPADPPKVTAAPSRPRALNRRGILAGFGGALAAGVAGLAIAPGFFGAKPAAADPVETFFHDFETYLIKDRALDVTETEMVKLASWYGNRLSFELPPVGARSGDVRLIGGRLCWLMERRLASLCYESASGPIVLYVMNSKGIRVPHGRDQQGIGQQVSWHRSKGHGCVMWTSDQLFYVMVGTQDVHSLLNIARSIIS